jgi:hypothetical protein
MGLRWEMGCSFCIQWIEVRGGLFILLIITKFSFHNNNYRECKKTVKIFRKCTDSVFFLIPQTKNIQN